MGRKRKERYADTEYFHYHNANSHNHLSDDCVIRAIATATGKSWEDMLTGLYKIGIKYGFTPTDDHTVARYLKDFGLCKMNEPRDCNNKKLTCKEFLKNNPDLCAVANVGSHHMVAIRHGKVYDIWDSSNNIIHSYWVFPSQANNIVYSID